MWIKEFVQSLPTASTPDSRWGLVGIAVGFLLFVPPLAIYFFDKGGILDMPTWVWITFGMIVSVAWVTIFVMACLLFRSWWLDTRNRIIQENLKRTREAENERNNKPN